MNKAIHDLLFDTDLDLNQSVVIKDDPSRFVVRSRIGGARIGLGLLFGIPCLLLILYALREQGTYLLFALVFCPPLAALGALFGLVRQEKTFIPAQGKAIKAIEFLHIRRDLTVPLPKHGALLVYKRFSSSSEGGGCYFYHAEIQGINGFGFCIAKNESRRDDFARDLADLLHYEIRIGNDRSR